MLRVVFVLLSAGSALSRAPLLESVRAIRRDGGGSDGALSQNLLQNPITWLLRQLDEHEREAFKFASNGDNKGVDCGISLIFTSQPEDVIEDYTSADDDADFGEAALHAQAVKAAREDGHLAYDYADAEAEFGPEPSKLELMVARHDKKALGNDLKPDATDDGSFGNFWPDQGQETKRIMDMMDAAYEASLLVLRGDDDEDRHVVMELTEDAMEQRLPGSQGKKHLRGGTALTSRVHLAEHNYAEDNFGVDDDNVATASSLEGWLPSSVILFDRAQAPTSTSVVHLTNVNYYIMTGGINMEWMTLITLLCLTSIMTVFFMKAVWALRRTAARDSALKACAQENAWVKQNGHLVKGSLGFCKQQLQEGVLL